MEIISTVKTVNLSRSSGLDYYTVQEKLLAYYAHMALSIPNPEDRDHERIFAMASACTLSYFGRKNWTKVNKYLDKIKASHYVS